MEHEFREGLVRMGFELGTFSVTDYGREFGLFITAPSVLELDFVVGKVSFLDYDRVVENVVSDAIKRFIDDFDIDRYYETTYGDAVGSEGLTPAEYYNAIGDDIRYFANRIQYV